MHQALARLSKLAVVDPNGSLTSKPPKIGAAIGRFWGINQVIPAVLPAITPPAHHNSAVLQRHRRRSCRLGSKRGREGSTAAAAAAAAVVVVVVEDAAD